MEPVTARVTFPAGRSAHPTPDWSDGLVVWAAMGLSFYLLLLCIVSGLVSGVMAMRRKAVLGAAVAMLVGIAGTIGANRLWPLDGFGLIHVFYLAAVVSLPMFLVGGWFGLRRDDRAPRSRWLLPAVATSIVAVGIYATHIEPYRLEIVREQIVSAQISEPVRIVVLSDIQNSSVGDYEYEVMDAIIAEEPDLVLMAGDLWQLPPWEWPQQIHDFEDLLAYLLEGVPGLVMVDGDSDWPDGYDQLVQRVGPRSLFLFDETSETFVGDQRVVIGGAARGEDNSPAERAVLETLVAAPDDALTILLGHRPAVVFRPDASDGIDLVVAGHTHGGQVSVPFFGPPITFSEVPREVAAGGLHEVDGVPIFVTRGVGMERHQAPQLRFNVRPSIGVIDFVPD